MSCLSSESKKISINTEFFLWIFHLPDIPTLLNRHHQHCQILRTFPRTEISNKLKCLIKPELLIVLEYSSISHIAVEKLAEAKKNEQTPGAHWRQIPQGSVCSWPDWQEFLLQLKDWVFNSYSPQCFQAWASWGAVALAQGWWGVSEHREAIQGLELTGIIDV